jgi:Arc/MetJ-type ribon-helix-helix transcriptional regulator
MLTQKLSISLPIQQFEFIEHYQQEHHVSSRSEVISEALCLLQQHQLEACYREANQEMDDAFDATTSDGLDENETW